MTFGFGVVILSAFCGPNKPQTCPEICAFICETKTETGLAKSKGTINKATGQESPTNAARKKIDLFEAEARIP